MSSKKANISHIRKYLNGELNAGAMHRLEQEALDDPFLMDALEGYETTKKDEQVNLNELTERLRQRTSESRGRVVSWKVWSIAASVLVLLTIGGLWLKKAPTNEKLADVVLAPPDKTAVKPLKDTVKAALPLAETPLTAQKAKPAPKTTVLKPAGRPVQKLADKAVYQQEISASDAVVAAPAPQANVVSGNAPAPVKPQEDKKDNTQRLSEVVVMNYTSKSKQDSIDNAIADSKKARYSAVPAESKLQGRVDGLTVVTSKDAKTQFGPGRIAGIIISKDNGSPVIGAAIRIKGTNKSTVTDANGFFALPVSPVASNKETLDIASIGYEKKQVSAKGGDSLKVELDQDKASLSEVAVVGYGTKKGALTEPVIENAHPQTGWGDFKKYLQANAVLPDGTTGTVNLTFTVGADGVLSDFTIKKSLNSVADQKAIDLIKAGPAWAGNNNKQPEQVTVKVKFQKQK